MKSKSSGNVLFIILIAVALFAALTAVVSQISDQSQKGLGEEKASLVVDQIFEFAQSVKTGTNFIYTNNNILESDIRFAHPSLDTDYGNPAGLNAEQMVFHPSGGGVTYKAPPANANNGAAWLITGQNYVLGVGTAQAAACGPDCNALMLFLPNVDEEICREINKRQNISFTTYPVETYEQDMFAGTFDEDNALGDAAGSVALVGKKQGCFVDGADNYHFYAVLLER